MKRTISFLFVAFIFLLPLDGLAIGSTTAVAVEGTTILPSGPGSTMIGFSVFAAGFAFTDSTTTSSFSAYFPISGTVTLSNGALYLQQNAYLEAPVAFNSVGTIMGGGYFFYLPPVESSFSLPELSILKLSASANPNANPVNSIDWSFDNAYVAIAVNHGNVSAPGLFVYSFNGTTLTLQASATLPRNTLCVSWHPSNYFIAVGDGTGGAQQVSIYNFIPAGPTLTLETGSLTFAANVNAVAWTPNGNYIAYSKSTVATGVNVASVSAGVIGTPIPFNLGTSGAVQPNALSWNASSDHLAAGLTLAATTTEVFIFNFNSTTSTLTTAASINTGATVSALDWSKTNSLIAIGLTGGTNNVQLYSFVSSTSVVTELVASLLGETRSISAIQWNPAGNLLAVAYATGTLGVTVYSFNSTTSVLTPSQEIGYANVVNALRWSHDGKYLAFGDAGNTARVYQNGASDNFIFNNTTLALQGDLALTGTYEFQGTCAIEGNGYAINCASGAMQIDSGASLLIRNAKVTGINASNIIGATTTSALSLQNSTWIQSGNYTFSQGALNIIDNVIMNGQYSFIYTSSQLVTINADSSWLFDSGMTFSYAPTSGANNLLAMTDSTSLFHLYETTLYAPSTGLKFTKGTIVIEGVCPVISKAISQANGIVFGDGISSANNAVLNVWPGSNFQITSGFVLYQNM